MLLYDKPVRRELGLVHTTDKACCLLDGYNCDKYKYLKNDYLTVTVWAIIKDTCEAAGIQIPTIREIDKLLDEKTFEIYDKGLTCTINQADSDFATGLVEEYKPRSVSEMSAFVAIIRPGCASLLQDFIHRQPYTTGVKELDDILVEGKHRMIYQELIMKYLIWLGIPETGSYDIIKKIAKKKFKEKELADLKEKLLEGWIEKVGTEEGFVETWTVVEQAARYSFNASHSLSYAYDSLYGAYLKSHYPLEYYTTVLNYYSGDEARTLKLTNELKYFGIKLRPVRFRFSGENYVFNRKTNEIYKGVKSIKYMNSKVAKVAILNGNKSYISFIDCISDFLTGTAINMKQMRILIDLDFFEEFGDANYLNMQLDLFDKYSGRSQISKNELNTLHVSEEEARSFSAKETAKMFSGIDSLAMLRIAATKLKYRRRTLREKIGAQIEHLGYVDIVGDQYSGIACVTSIDTKYSPRLTLYSLKNGTSYQCKIDKRTFSQTKLAKGDILKVVANRFKPRVKKDENGNWVEIPDTRELWITKYQRLDNL